MNDPQFQRLLDLYFDNGLKAEELAEFERILLSNQQARIEFWQQAHLHQALRCNGAEAWGGRIAQSETRRRRTPMLWVGAAAAVLFASLATWLWVNRPAKKTIAQSPPEKIQPSDSLPSKPDQLPASVAVISDMVGADWDAPNELRKGTAIGEGQVILRSGLVGLTFYNGAHVMIEGPAHINILSDSAMQLNRGNARIECPEVAHGFTVETPGGQVVDLGTVFGLAVDETGTTEVQVIKGLVTMRGRDQEENVELREQGVAVMETTGSIHFRDKAEQSNTESFSQRIQDQGQQQFKRWRDNSAQRAGDEDLLVYLRMLDDKDSTARLVKNEGGSQSASAAAAIIAPNWVNGRWPGKRALLFQNADERARIQIDGRYTKLTFAAWVKILGFQRPFNALFMSDCNTEGELHWQFSNRGAFRFSVRPSKQMARHKRMGSRFHRTWTQEMLHSSDNGVWRHLVTVYDGENKRVVHYIDGQEATRHVLPEGVAVGFGKSTIGNTSYATKQYWGSRQFGGAVDEFAIYSRVLSPKEVQTLYEEGRSE